VNDADRWWETAVFYEIYLRSFADSTGDGIGDLEGIRRRLDHLVDLGVDLIWLTPFYPSPMADLGLRRRRLLRRRSPSSAIWPGSTRCWPRHMSGRSA
jgi:hypothetical protein